jgi:hypothetical protein
MTFNIKATGCIAREHFMQFMPDGAAIRESLLRAGDTFGLKGEIRGKEIDTV